jgi:hypothetical protein
MAEARAGACIVPRTRESSERLGRSLGHALHTHIVGMTSALAGIQCRSSDGTAPLPAHEEDDAPARRPDVGPTIPTPGSGVVGLSSFPSSFQASFWQWTRTLPAPPTSFSSSRPLPTTLIFWLRFSPPRTKRAAFFARQARPEIPRWRSRASSTSAAPGSTAHFHRSGPVEL